ncbi:AraC family ligand binding domain-containing protein, partial [Shinella sp.]|uniref:AraC family ligand binding domain-containing protein n=1 Tax=Shinella sp. TaxID=1870904 RepID=UPI0028A0444E
MASGRFQVLRTAIDGVEAVIADSSHVTYGIGLVERGAQRSASGRGHVEAQAGNTITVNPGEVHDGAPVGGASRAWRMLYMRPGIVAAAAQ